MCITNCVQSANADGLGRQARYATTIRVSGIADRIETTVKLLARVAHIDMGGSTFSVVLPA